MVPLTKIIFLQEVYFLQIPSAIAIKLKSPTKFHPANHTGMAAIAVRV
ncbi:MAG: hypothetical protein KME08_04755 [Aphanothece sp. CMT-3BRIN-NPC111]|nr:hypothetical protein [Aphanothece sp. CMT-3BRIN-NPC111]